MHACGRLKRVKGVFGLHGQANLLPRPLMRQSSRPTSMHVVNPIAGEAVVISAAEVHRPKLASVKLMSFKSRMQAEMALRPGASPSESPEMRTEATIAEIDRVELTPSARP